MIAADSTCSLMIKTSQEHTLELLAKKTKQKKRTKKKCGFQLFLGTRKSSDTGSVIAFQCYVVWMLKLVNV